MNETTTIQEIEELQLEEEELLEVSIINEGFNDDDDDIYEEEEEGGGETVDESLAPLKEEVATIEEGGNVNQLVSEIHEIEEEIDGKKKTTWTDRHVFICASIRGVYACPTQFIVLTLDLSLFFPMLPSLYIYIAVEALDDDGEFLDNKVEYVEDLQEIMEGGEYYIYLYIYIYIFDY